MFTLVIQSESGEELSFELLAVPDYKSMHNISNLLRTKFNHKVDILKRKISQTHLTFSEIPVSVFNNLKNNLDLSLINQFVNKGRYCGIRNKKGFRILKTQ